jgi:hypothetical protein
MICAQPNTFGLLCACFTSNSLSFTALALGYVFLKQVNRIVTSEIIERKNNSALDLSVPTHGMTAELPEVDP